MATVFDSAKPEHRCRTHSWCRIRFYSVNRELIFWWPTTFVLEDFSHLILDETEIPTVNTVQVMTAPPVQTSVCRVRPDLGATEYQNDDDEHSLLDLTNSHILPVLVGKKAASDGQLSLEDRDCIYGFLPYGRYDRTTQAKAACTEGTSRQDATQDSLVDEILYEGFENRIASPSLTRPYEPYKFCGDKGMGSLRLHYPHSIDSPQMADTQLLWVEDDTPIQDLADTSSLMQRSLAERSRSRDDSSRQADSERTRRQVSSSSCSSDGLAALVVFGISVERALIPIDEDVSVDLYRLLIAHHFQLAPGTDSWNALSIHPIVPKPEDLAPCITPLIARFLGEHDLSTSITLVDVEMHSNLPSTCGREQADPQVLREVWELPVALTRNVLLNKLGIAELCRHIAMPCVVQYGHHPWHQQDARPYPITDGLFLQIRISIPEPAFPLIFYLEYARQGVQFRNMIRHWEQQRARAAARVAEMFTTDDETVRQTAEEATATEDGATDDHSLMTTDRSVIPNRRPSTPRGQILIIYEYGSPPFTAYIDPSLPFDRYRHAIGVLMEIDVGTRDWDNFAIFQVRPRPPHLDPLTQDSYLLKMPEHLIRGQVQLVVRLQLFRAEECARSDEYSEIQVMSFPQWLDRESFLVNAYFRDLCMLFGTDTSEITVAGKIWYNTDFESRYLFDAMFASIRCRTNVRHIPLSQQVNLAKNGNVQAMFGTGRDHLGEEDLSLVLLQTQLRLGFQRHAMTGLRPPGNGARKPTLDTLDDVCLDCEGNYTLVDLPPAEPQRLNLAEILKIPTPMQRRQGQTTPPHQNDVAGQASSTALSYAIQLEQIPGTFEKILHFEPETMCPEVNWRDIPELLPCVEENMKSMTIVPWYSWDQEADEILVYTDGSYNGSQTSWACLFLARAGHEWLMLGYFHGTERDPEAPHGALHGENLALQWATLWTLRYLHATDWIGPVTFLWDAMVPGKRSSGDYQIRSDARALQTRHLQQALEALLGEENVAHSHVKAHSGIWPNEFVDAAAKAAHREHPRSIPEQELAMLATLPPESLTWLWFHVQQTKNAYPDYAQGMMKWTQDSDFSTLNVEELINSALMPGHKAEEARQVELSFELKLGTYNCLSLGTRADCKRDEPFSGITGQIPLLRQQAHDLHFHLLGLQECRTEVGIVRSGTHLRICSGADANKCFGVELWVDLQHPFAWLPDGTPKFFQSHFFAVIHAAPRILVVNHTAPEMPVILVIAHAPHEGHDGEVITGWWQHFRKILEPYRFDDQIHFLDANARLSGESTTHFGDLQDGAPRRDSRLLREHAAYFGLIGPSTFSCWHKGSIHTWSHPNGSAEARLDYVLIPLGWQLGVWDSFVDRDFHIPRSFQDHSCAALRMSWTAIQTSKQTKQSGIDADSMTTKEGREKLETIWKNLPTPNWGMNATHHAHVITMHLQQELRKAFPRKKKMRHCSIASEQTLGFFHITTQTKRQLREYRHLVKLAHSRFWFDLWRGDQWEETNLRWVAQLFRSFASLTAQVPKHAKMLTRSVRQDRRDYTSKIVQDAVHAAPHEMYKVLRPLLPNRKTPAKGPKPLPQLNKLDGEKTTSYAEIQQRWTEHFGAMEGGKEEDPKSFILNALYAQAQTCKPKEWQLADLPSLDHLERAVHKVRCGRAPGPDGLPAELFKACPRLAAKHLFPLLLKFVCRIEEPIQHKGGSLISLYKGKGSHHDCSSFRSILLLSNMGKLLRTSMRQMVNTPYEKSTDALQFGGKRFQQVVFGAQGVRHFLQHTKNQGISAGIIFADIASAFYTVIREVTLGASTSDLDIATVVKRLGLGPELMPQLHSALAGQNCYAQLGASVACQSYLRQSLEHTWFGVASTHFVATTKGSRPGDSWADVVFNILFSAILTELKQELQDQGVILHLSPPAEKTIWPEQTLYGQPVSVWQTTWADDLALLLRFSSPSKVPYELAHAGSALFRALKRFGLRATIGAGKTEALVLVRGKGALQIRRQLFSCHKPTLPIFDEDEIVQLPITTRYKHLGGWVTSQCNLMSEIRHRLSKAKSAFWRISRDVLRNKRLDLTHRIQLFRAIVISTLCWGSGAWPYMTHQEYGLFASGVWELIIQAYDACGL